MFRLIAHIAQLIDLPMSKKTNVHQPLDYFSVFHTIERVTHSTVQQYVFMSDTKHQKTDIRFKEIRHDSQKCTHDSRAFFSCTIHSLHTSTPSMKSFLSDR